MDARQGLTFFTSPSVIAASSCHRATTSVDSTHRPTPPPNFGGVIQPAVNQSNAWWPRQVRPLQQQRNDAAR